MVNSVLILCVIVLVFCQVIGDLELHDKAIKQLASQVAEVELEVAALELLATRAEHKN